MTTSTHVNLCTHRRRATWQHPVSGNVLSGDSGAAVSVVCDACIETKQTIGLAVEFVDLPHGEVRYHDLATLDRAVSRGMKRVEG